MKGDCQMTKVGAVFVVALIATGVAHARPIAVPAPAPHAMPGQQVASFSSCYMDAFMAAQRYAQRKLGNVAGVAAIGVIDAFYGAGASAFIALDCAT